MSWNVPTTVATGGILSSANWNDVALNMADSGWIAVPNGSMSNSFVNGGIPFAYRLIGNTVRLRGSVASGTSGTLVLTFPVGYRPQTNQQFTGQQTAGVAETTLIIDSNGQMFVWYSGTGCTFDGITFTND